MAGEALFKKIFTKFLKFFIAAVKEDRNQSEGNRSTRELSH